MLQLWNYRSWLSLGISALGCCLFLLFIFLCDVLFFPTLITASPQLAQPLYVPTASDRGHRLSPSWALLLGLVPPTWAGRSPGSWSAPPRGSDSPPF